MSWFEGVSSSSEVDVAELLAGLGSQGVVELVEAGALVSIAKTRDGGAMGVTVTVDGEYVREYFRKQDELLAWFAQLIPAVSAARNGGNRPSAASGSRKRRA